MQGGLNLDGFTVPLYGGPGLVFEVIMQRPETKPGSSSDEKIGSPVMSKDEIEAMIRREREIMGILNTDNPDKIIHDLRNVMNELTLLRRALDAEA